MPWWVYPLVMFGGAGTVGAIAISAVRGTNPQEYHNRQTCMCYHCRMARYRAMRSSGQIPIGYRENGTPIWSGELPKENPRNLATRELKKWMIVEVFDAEYRVSEVKHDDQGYVIGLVNMKTHSEFVVPIKELHADRKFWVPRGWIR